MIDTEKLAERTEKSRGERNSALVVGAIALALLGGIFLWFGFYRPTFEHADLDAIRAIRTSSGPRWLTKEAIGRGTNMVVAYRTSLIDPDTLTRSARSLSSDAEGFLGQAAGNGVLWFRQDHRGADNSRFTAWNPDTFERVAIYTDIEQAHPNELGLGIYSFAFDEKRKQMSIVSNANRSWLLVPSGDGKSGAFDLINPDDYDDAEKPPVPNRALPMPARALELIKSDWPDLRDGNNGEQAMLANPPGALLTSRDSLLETAGLTLYRLDDSGEPLWKHAFPRSRGISKVYLYKEKLYAVSNGFRGAEDDWITELDPKTGNEGRKYQF